MALTLDEVLLRVEARTVAVPATGGGVDDVVRRVLDLTQMDGEEGVDALRGVAGAVVVSLGVKPTARSVEQVMAACLVVLLSGYEVGCSVTA